MQKITVLCGGCFNIVHEGHVCFLQRAKALGERLVVVVANDAHNKKPYARPAPKRAAAVRALGIADKVITGDAKGFLPVVLREKPKIIALGYDQMLPCEVSEKVRELGIRVRRIRKCKDFSTRALQRSKNGLL